MSPSRLPFPSFPLSLGPFLSWFPSACRHVPTHLRSRLTTLPSVHPNTVPLCTAPTQPITRLLFHFSSVFTFPLSTFPQVRSSTVHESTHRPRARPCEYPPCSQFHLFTFSLSTFLPIHTPLCTIHPPTCLPTYLPPSLHPSPLLSLSLPPSLLSPTYLFIHSSHLPTTIHCLLIRPLPFRPPPPTIRCPPFHPSTCSYFMFALYLSSYPLVHPSALPPSFLTTFLFVRTSFHPH